MDEVENQVAHVEVPAPNTETPKENVETQEAKAAEPAENRAWAQMRVANKELERKLKMQEEMMSQLLAAKTGAISPSPEVDELANIPADDYIPKGQVEKLVQRKAEKIAEEAVKKALEAKEQAEFHTRLRTKFSDFDEVVTPETLELLEQNDPDLAKTIIEIRDPYKMGLQSYKFIKSMGLSEKVPSHRRAKEVDKKIEQNAKTIQSPQVFDKRPMAQTFQLTEAMKNELYKEMNQCASLAGSVPQL